MAVNGRLPVLLHGKTNEKVFAITPNVESRRTGRLSEVLLDHLSGLVSREPHQLQSSRASSPPMAVELEAILEMQSRVLESIRYYDRGVRLLPLLHVRLLL